MEAELVGRATAMAEAALEDEPQESALDLLHDEGVQAADRLLSKPIEQGAEPRSD